MKRILIRGAIVVATLLHGCALPVAKAPPAFRVISYNVLVGYRDYRVGNPYHPGATRKKNIHSYLANAQPDVVAFQELNGYSEERLRDEATTWGHAHAVLLKDHIL